MDRADIPPELGIKRSQDIVQLGQPYVIPVFEMVQLADALVRDVRLLVAIGLHTGELSVDEATDMFRRDALLSDEAARTEAERGTFDPGAVRYTLGKRMLVKLRDDLRVTQGGEYSDRAFHDEFLYWGMVPIPIVRARILAGNPGKPL